MKFSAYTLLALAAMSSVKADKVGVCYLDESGDEISTVYPATRTALSTIGDWYGYGDDYRASSNTPTDIELSNAETLGFVPVKFNDGTHSLAMILDNPVRRSNAGPLDGTLITKITCTEEDDGACGTFPNKSFLKVKDDGGDKYQSSGGALYSAHKWWDCCTDGWATEHLSGCSEICVEILSAADISGISGINDARRKDPSGLSSIAVWSGGDDNGGGAKKTLKNTGPADGDRYCFKSCPAKAFDDPHFKTLGGKAYDFMGACDLVLMDAPNFTSLAGLRVVIRTTIRYAYSYIESAVIAIGDDRFEVSSFGQYAVNGISNAELPATLNDFTIIHTQPSEKVHLFQVKFSESESITIKTFKDMVSVKWGQFLGHRLDGARGMLGDADNGEMLGRNGTVTFEDPNEFAAEWQVRQDEEMLFMTSRAPQHPAQCVLPDTTNAAQQRRLGESMMLEAAEKACSKWEPDMRAACVHDVIATGDLELADAGAF